MNPSIGMANVDKFLNEFLMQDQAVAAAEMLKTAGPTPQQAQQTTPAGQRVTVPPTGPGAERRGPRVNPAPAPAAQTPPVTPQ